MRNVLLNLVHLSMAVASIPTGLIMKLGRARSAPLVLHGRKLSQVSVSSVAELTAAVGNSAVDKILVAAGTYDFTSEMCYGSASLHQPRPDHRGAGARKRGARCQGWAPGL